MQDENLDDKLKVAQIALVEAQTEDLKREHIRKKSETVINNMKFWFSVFVSILTGLYFLLGDTLLEKIRGAIL